MNTPGKASGRRAMTALFVIYALLLAWCVLWKLGMPCVGSGRLRVVQLVPFRGTTLREAALNAVIFVPFGVYAAFLWPKRRAGTLAAAAGLSLALETLQYALAVGRSDVTDVLTNTLGAAAGLLLARLLAKCWGKRSARFVPVLCAAGTVLALLAAAWFATHVHYREAL